MDTQFARNQENIFVTQLKESAENIRSTSKDDKLASMHIMRTRMVPLNEEDANRKLAQMPDSKMCLKTKENISLTQQDLARAEAREKKERLQEATLRQILEDAERYAEHIQSNGTNNIPADLRDFQAAFERGLTVQTYQGKVDEQEKRRQYWSDKKISLQKTITEVTNPH